MTWMDRYNAAKGGPPARQAPPPPPPPQQPPSQAYQQPYGYEQPIPGAPPHAPYGYDQMNGAPRAPYGYLQDGRIAGPPQGYQQPAYQPNGLPTPQGYDPAYNGPQQPYNPPAPPTEVDDQGNSVVHTMDAVMAYKGGKGVQSVGICPECGEDSLYPRTVGNEGKRLNTSTGQFVEPAPECARCGYNGLFTQMGSTGGAGSASGVKVTGKPRLAPGAGNMAQVAGQHGLPNLFAPK